MFLNHFQNFYPGVCRDQLIEVAAHFRIVASLAYLPVNSSVKRNQECLLRSRQIAKALVELRTSSSWEQYPVPGAFSELVERPGP
jgi:hypothetical protein